MSEKLKMQTENLADKNFAKLAELFPNAVTESVDEEGNVIRAIDKDILQQEINAAVVEGREERYQFTWPDKKKAIAEANKPITKTLRPCREESVDFDHTENLYIEGDNLEVLKLLQETYLGKVKMIYIDPPYNTGHDMVYQDDLFQGSNEYKGNSGDYDEEGNRLFQNTTTNGRFHTDWLNMMYPRLKLAKNLLTDDGVIFISIDDNEVENLKKICDEVFGESNFIAQIVWERAYSPVNLMKHFSVSHDYIISYAKNLDNAVCNGLPRSEEANERYDNPDNDPRGVWKASDLSVGPAVASNIYEIITPSGRIVEPPAGRSWSLSKKAFFERLQDNRIWFGSNGDNVPAMKRFLSELRKQGITPMTIWKYEDVGHSQGATQDLAKMFDGKKFFDYPKPVGLMKRIVQLYSVKDCVILDFFSGSATTAHAVMQLNVEDGGHRKFIMVQLPEKCDEKSEAFKAGYKNICEIGKERIRRAAKFIREANAPFWGKQDDSFWGKPEENFWGKNADKAPKFDGGFRVLKVDTSNMEDVYYTPNKTEQGNLGMFAENVKVDRTVEDLLFQVMLDLGIDLSSKIEQEQIAGKQVFNVAEGFMIACFDVGLDEKVITAIAKQKPQYFVTRDSSIASDDVFTNFEQLFMTYSPDTNRKVL